MESIDEVYEGDTEGHDYVKKSDVTDVTQLTYVSNPMLEDNESPYTMINSLSEADHQVSEPAELEVASLPEVEEPVYDNRPIPLARAPSLYSAILFMLTKFIKSYWCTASIGLLLFLAIMFIFSVTYPAIKENF